MPFETWETDSGTSKTKLAIMLLILVIAVVVSFKVVDAVYHITSPPSDTVTVTQPQTLSKPTVSATSVTVGETITISTTLSDGTAGVVVTFFENDNVIGSDSTDDKGTATYTRVLISVGSYTYYADCLHP